MALPTDSAARKRIPIFSGLFKYFPDALAAVAELSFEANEKHNPGEPLHWSREKSNDHPDCVGRHMIDFALGHRDALREAAWRILAVLQLDIEANGPIRSNEYAKKDAIAAFAPLPEKFETVEQYGLSIAEREAAKWGMTVKQYVSGHRIGEIGACDCSLCIQEALVDRGTTRPRDPDHF